MKYTLLFCLTLLPCFALDRDPRPTDPQAPQPKLQIALLLDTSNSMDGLINQARTRLWEIVNLMARARKNGRMPRLEVALYEYGKSSLPAEQGYLTQCVGLTSDLDRISEALFALNTNGGDEYCGQVINKATHQLEWSPNPKDYKAIFIAGNEPFDQGQVPYERSCAAAIAKGIIVNTIFCGNRSEGIATRWKDGADLGDGSFLILDQNQTIVEVTAPQDDRILALNQKLNETYIAYGQEGVASKTRQEAQDAQVAGASKEAAVQRTMAKASKAFAPAAWDLVTAAESGAVELADVAPAALPEPMKNMDDTEKKAFVETKAKERAQLQAEIEELNRQRQAYLDAHKPASQETLGEAMRTAILAQMGTKQFTFAP